MNTPKSFVIHLGSLFVTSAFLDAFCGGLARDICMTVGMAEHAPRAPFYTEGSGAAFPMAAVLRATLPVCSEVCIANEVDLAYALQLVRNQFDVTVESNAADEAKAMELLERAFADASRSAWETWREVAAGFPVSGGDFVVWKTELQQRDLARIYQSQ